LHRAFAGQSNPAGSWRRQRVAVVCWTKQTRRLQHTDPPPRWTGRGWSRTKRFAILPVVLFFPQSIRHPVFGLNYLIRMS
jgi:hypothetical protein